MNPFPMQSSAQPLPHWAPFLAPNPPLSSSFWGSINVHHQLKDLQETLSLAKAMQKELEILVGVKDKEGSSEEPKDVFPEVSMKNAFLKHLGDRSTDLKSQESSSVQAANFLMAKLKSQLEPFRVVTDVNSPWEEKSAVIRLGGRIEKSKKNKLWRKKRRKRMAELKTQECERFAQANREADEWRAREMAKEISKQKVEKMKEIAKHTAKEEKKKLESELELVLMVERLQELRSMRIQKMKKQGHFIPEEDDEFLERVQAAVEEEERQAIAAAQTGAAAQAIASAEETRKSTQPHPKDTISSAEKRVKHDAQDNLPTAIEGTIGVSAITSSTDGSVRKDLPEGNTNGNHDHVTNLPPEFYHYYHGSNHDMGTLIEVRRTWDAYIRPGGSRIPGHWVQPPPPANDIWASYLVNPKSN